MKNSGFTTKMDRHTLGGASVHGKKKSRRLSSKKRGGGGGFRLGVDSERIGGLAEVQDYDCHESVKSMKGGDGHSTTTEVQADTSVTEVDTSTLDLPEAPVDAEGVNAEASGGEDATMDEGAMPEDAVANGAEGGMDDGAAATEGNVVADAMEAVIDGGDAGMDATDSPAVGGGKRKLSKTLRKLCCLKRNNVKIINLVVININLINNVVVMESVSTYLNELVDYPK